MIESARGIAWLVATLTADTAFMAAIPGGLWRGMGPEQGVPVTYPMGVLQFQGGKDIWGSNRVRLWNDGAYVVKIVGVGDQDAAVFGAVDLADTALQNASGSAQGGTILVCLREMPFGPMDEVVDGQHFLTAGGVYNLLVTSL